MKKFAFIVHLRTFEDIIYSLPIPKFLTLMLKPFFLHLFLRLKGRSGFSVRKVKIRGKTEGYIFLLWLTGEQIGDARMAHKMRQRVLGAVLYAQNKLRCDIVGLGALTASITDAGQWLIKQPGINIAITHGDSYTVAVAMQGIRKITNLGGITLALIGAAGVVGKGLAYQLAQMAPATCKIILIGRNGKLGAIDSLVEKLRKDHNVHSSISTSSNLDDVAQADIIITATSFTGNLIEGRHLKKGAIIYEIAQPRNVPKEVLTERPDVTIIDGAYVKLPADMSLWRMSLPKETLFACLAETIMQALRGDLSHHIGEIDPFFVQETERRAKQYKFGHAPFTSFDEQISASRLFSINRDQGRKIKETILVSQGKK